MTTGSPALVKLFSMKHVIIEINDVFYHVIPDDSFTEQEVNELRRLDDLSFETDGERFIANFLPDDIRPKNVPKL